MPTNVTDWTRVGCFFSNSNPTLVNTTSFYDDRMTPQRCTAACAESGKSFAAMQKRGPGPWVRQRQTGVETCSQSDICPP